MDNFIKSKGLIIYFSLWSQNMENHNQDSQENQSLKQEKILFSDVTWNKCKE